MSPTLPRVLVDVSQWASWPASSGVQRVLRHLAERWPGERTEARFGFVDGGNYVVGPFAAFADVISGTFAASADAPATPDVVQAALRAGSSGLVAADELERTFDAFVLPEPTLRRDNLAVADRLMRASRPPVFFVYYDALPLTHPELYPKLADLTGTVTRYHRTVARSDNVAFISQPTKDVFERRLSRRTLPHGMVARPGGDGLPRPTAARTAVPTFAIVGTVEPRKRHRLVVEAFERLWSDGRDYRLILVGSAGWEHPDFVTRLRRLSASGRLEWIENATDGEIANVLASSWALVFPPYAEGYGLPPVEALALGCPVVVEGGLPALVGLDEGGQIRLATADAASLAEAVDRLAEPEVNDAHRAAAAGLDVPTWGRFAAAVEDWIASVLDEYGSG